MPFRSSVTIVASPRARVGKTLLARLLTDFNAQEGRSVAAFDLNAGGDTLAQFLPERTAVSTIGDVQGQMALFDRLIAEDGAAKVVDLGHESF
jgi:MinD-like ATPase involved in chromosome partitioning or flagellar assembly